MTVVSRTVENDEVKGLVNWPPEYWAWCLTLLFLFLRFFTQVPSIILYFSYTTCMLFFALLSLNGMNRAVRVGNAGLNGALLCLCFSVLVIATFSPYSKEELVKFCLLLIDAYILVGIMGAVEFKPATKLFYWACSVVIVFTFGVYLVEPSFFSNVEGAYQGLFYSPIFFGVPDNNDTAVVMFLLVCLAFKKGWKLGIALGFIYPFLYFGRQYIMMALIVLAVVIVYFIRMRITSAGGSELTLPPRAFYVAFACSTLALILLAYFWVFFVAGNGTSAYKESLNDSSNAIRMNSNVYCFERMINNPEFLIYGYDDDVFDELGISSTDYSPEANYLVNGVYRLVQPHEEVLNMVLKEGLLFSVSYYATISQLLCIIPWGAKSRAILVAYFIGSLFLAGFFRDFRLMAFLVVAIAGEVPLRSHAVTRSVSASESRPLVKGEVIQ